METPQEQPSVATLVELMTALHIACGARGHEASALVQVPTWGGTAPAGELEVVSVSGAFPVRVVVTIPWAAGIERELARPAPSGSLVVQFCWERVPAVEWNFADIPAIAGLLRAGLEALPGCRALTITLPTVFDDASWGLGPIDLRHDWQLDLSALADAAARQTALASIAAHAIDGLRWLSEDHQLPVVPLALSV